MPYTTIFTIIMKTYIVYIVFLSLFIFSLFLLIDHLFLSVLFNFFSVFITKRDIKFMHIFPTPNFFFFFLKRPQLHLIVFTMAALKFIVHRVCFYSVFFFYIFLLLFHRHFFSSYCSLFNLCKLICTQFTRA